MQKNTTQMRKRKYENKKRKLKRIRRFELRLLESRLCLELSVNSNPNSWADSNAPPLGGGGMKCLRQTERRAEKSHGIGWAFRSVNDFVGCHAIPNCLAIDITSTLCSTELHVFIWQLKMCK
jgi:hypothetical protein